jgi:hypothetical protein
MHSHAYCGLKASYAFVLAVKPLSSIVFGSDGLLHHCIPNIYADLLSSV